ncbi:hypothetical protein CXR25_11815 [Brevibacterium aurantiacum]|nr:hypothetical protein CXR25_11815 [Brevibacterium aurantiacum]
MSLCVRKELRDLVLGVKNHATICIRRLSFVILDNYDKLQPLQRCQERRPHSFDLDAPLPKGAGKVGKSIDVILIEM